MNSIEQDSRNRTPSPAHRETNDANYFAFFGKPSPENLAANRRGVLTPEQKRNMTARIGSHRTSVFLMFGLGSVGILFLFFLMWVGNRQEGTVSFINLLVIAGVFIVLYGLLVLVMAGDTFVLFLPDDVADDRVESVRGIVVWKGNRYQAQSDDRQLRAMRRGVALPPPGHYLFYYLSRTGLVVMAEEAADIIQEPPASMLLESLARANHFAAEDLIRNHEGLLSQNQENRLLAALALYGFIVMSSLFLCGSIIFQILRGQISNLFLLLLAAGSYLVLRFGWITILLLGDLWNGKVKSIEGIVARESHKYRYVRSYYYVIDGRRFSILRPAYDALIEGKTYRLYYAPGSKHLVSIEPIENE